MSTKNNRPQKKDTKSLLEEAAAKQKQQKYILRLYVSGATARSARAIENIRRLSEEHLKGRYELEVIDIYQHPERAKSEQVIAAPTLIKNLPLPLRKFIGDLSDAERILVGLDLKEEGSAINNDSPE